MSFEQDWTRSPAFQAETDIHPTLRPADFAAIVERDRASATTGTATELDALHAEVMQDEVLQAMAVAQAGALRAKMVEVDPTLENATDAVIIDRFFELQLSDPNRALRVMNEATMMAAQRIEAQGLTSNDLATAISRAVDSAGHNLNGAVQDLSQMEVHQILTVAGLGFGSFMLTGSRAVGIGVGGLAAVMQSSHLTDLTINVAEAAGRGVVQAAALPIRGAMRTTAIINSIGITDAENNPIFDETAVSHLRGFGNDIVNSIAYTFDGDYSPERGLGGNMILREFYEQGEAFAPGPLRPFVLLLKETRNGGPITALPTEAEARAAGAFIAQVEELVTLDQFTAIQEKRISGQDLTPEENRQYILYKYCMIVNAAFIGDRGMIPYADAMTGAYEAEDQNITLEQAFASLTPAQQQALEDANFSWTPQQAADFEAHVEGMDITFENLTANGGFVGLALTAYLALTFAGLAFNAIRGGINRVGESRERAETNRRRPESERTISAGQRNQIAQRVEANDGNFGAVVTALVAANVLHEDMTFDRAIREQNLSEFGSEQRTALINAARNENVTVAQLRQDFFRLLESVSNPPNGFEALNQQRQHYYTYQEALGHLSHMYEYGVRGTPRTLNFGEQSVAVARPSSGDFSFAGARELQMGTAPESFYEFLDNNGRGRALNLRNAQNQAVNLTVRYRPTDTQFQVSNGRGGWQSFDMAQFAASTRAQTAEPAQS